MRYKIILSYDGSDYHGWQFQPSEASVQQTLGDALAILLRTGVDVVGAGRTDTGVNAIAYVAHFEAAEGLDVTNICYKLNAILPASIVVHEVVPVDGDFHARFDAVEREYRYFLHRCKDPFAGRYSWFCGYPGLDFGLMNRAAAYLLGRHDFSCFEKSGGDNKTSVCTVTRAEWVAYEPALPVWRRTDADGSTMTDYWCFTICADRFLRNMVRAVVGTLVEVGRGKRSLEDFRSLVLEPREPVAKTVRRSLAGESAPAHALFLTRISY